MCFSGDVFSGDIKFAANNDVFSNDNLMSALNILANNWGEFFVLVIAKIY